MENIVDTVNISDKRFKLTEEAQSYQLTIHFNNLLNYFSEEMRLYRVSQDQYISISEATIINLFKHMCENPWLCETYLPMRNFFPVETRIAQIINCYGEDLVGSYIKLIYESVA